MKYLFRYEIEYTTVDNETDVRLNIYPVVRETEHNYFIELPSLFINPKPIKKVNKNALNSFAYYNKEQAKDHFIRRTKKRISWFKFWKKECEEGLEIIKNK